MTRAIMGFEKYADSCKERNNCLEHPNGCHGSCPDYSEGEIEKKLHGKLYWYNISFAEVNDKLTLNSIQMGIPNNYVNNEVINKARIDCGIYNNSIILSCNYLGYMTEKEFFGE